MKHIVIDPGHGGTMGKDPFRQGPTGEREEWINLRVARELKFLLEAKGYLATLTRRRDFETSLESRVQLAKDSKADLFLSVHHASCDPVIESINFPFFYIHTNVDSLPQQLINSFKTELSKTDRGEAFGFSDNWVFKDGLYVLRECARLQIPAILTEFSFFSHPEEEQKLKTRSYCQSEAEVLFLAIHNYFQAEAGNGGSKEDLVLFPTAYKQQLNDIKASLVSVDSSLWQTSLVEAEKSLLQNDYQNAVIHFEKALAINPYHKDIVGHLDKMYVCTQQMKAEEYSDNLQALRRHVF